MPCNCKKNVNKLIELNGEENVGNTTNTKKSHWDIFQFLIRLPIGLLLGICVILTSIPLSIYIAFCTIFGIEGMVKIPNLNRAFARNPLPLGGSSSHSFKRKK